MNFNWNKDTIRWYREADAYTGFFQNIAGLIAPRLRDYTTFCDIGCGLGLVDIALSKYIDSITCVDINEAAIQELQKSIKEQGITNIRTKLMDCNDLNENWDVICVSFFGSRDLIKFLPLCKKLIAVVNKKNQTDLIPAKDRSFQKNTVEETEQLLLEKGIRYTLTEGSFEFGQPFVSREDAEKFVKTHSPHTSSAEVAEFLAHRLVETGVTPYPFFIPRMKSVGIFEIEGGV